MCYGLGEGTAGEAAASVTSIPGKRAKLKNLRWDDRIAGDKEIHPDFKT